MYASMVEVLRSEISEQRKAQREEREFLQARILEMEKENRRLRDEVLTMSSAASMAQLEAYRERRRESRAAVAVVPEAAAEPVLPPPDLSAMINLQDHYSDGVSPDDGGPPEGDEELERQVRAREEARAKAHRDALERAHRRES